MWKLQGDAPPLQQHVVVFTLIWIGLYYGEIVWNFGIAYDDYTYIHTTIYVVSRLFFYCYMHCDFNPTTIVSIIIIILSTTAKISKCDYILQPDNLYKDMGIICKLF